MAATKPFQTGVQLFEADYAAPVAESLAKGQRLLEMQRAADRSPGIRSTLKAIAETDPALATEMGLQHIRLDDGATPSTGLLAKSPAELLETAARLPRRSVVETKPQPRYRPQGAKPLLAMTDDQLLDYAMGRST